MDDVNVKIDGERYVKVTESGPVKIVVLDQGYVYVGRCETRTDELIIHYARCIIRWGTDKHLGQLIDGPLENTRLGDPCTVQVLHGKVIHTIEVNQNAWTS